MTDIAKVRVRVDATGHGAVFVNDMELPCIAISFGAEVGELTQVQLTIVADMNAEIEAALDKIALAKVKPDSGRPRSVDGRELRVRTRQA